MKPLPCKPCCKYCCKTCEWSCPLPEIEDRTTTNYNPISHQYQPVQQFSIDQQFQQCQFQQYQPAQQYQPVQQYSVGCQPYCY